MKDHLKDVLKEKKTKNPFPRSNNKEKGILDIVHSDVCKLISATSLSGYVYYVSFIDDYFKRKDEVFGKFKEFKVLVEYLPEKNIKILRSDNGGEFTSNEFKELCIEVGIKKELTTPYNPQQNGVVEIIIDLS